MTTDHLRAAARDIAAARSARADGSPVRTVGLLNRIALHLFNARAELFAVPIPPAVLTIQSATAAAFEVTVADLSGPSRRACYAAARHAAMALCRDLLNHSAELIAAGFGGRDHGTVLHAEKRVADRLATERDFAARYAKARASAQQSLGLHLTASQPTDKLAACFSHNESLHH